MTENTKQSQTVDIDKEIAEVQEQLQNVHGSECEVYARIVGYYRSVKNWNKGKKEEYGMRKMFDSKSKDAPAACGAVCLKQPNAEIASETAKAVAPSVAPQSAEGEHYELFVRAACPNCPPVKSYMASSALAGRSVDVDTESGLSEAALKGVFAAPTVIFYDAEGNETARAHTTEELKGIIPLQGAA